MPFKVQPPQLSAFAHMVEGKSPRPESPILPTNKSVIDPASFKRDGYSVRKLAEMKMGGGENHILIDGNPQILGRRRNSHFHENGDTAYLIIDPQTIDDVRRRTGDEQVATAGWSVETTSGKPFEIPSNGNDTHISIAGESKGQASYHFASRLFAPVIKALLPGTLLELPAQLFKFRDGSFFYRFKTSEKTDSPYYTAPAKRLGPFSIFVPSGGVKQHVVAGHMQRSASNPDVPLPAFKRDTEISFTAEPGKILVGSLTDLEENEDFATVKLGSDGVCYVKRSSEAKADPNLDIYQKLFKTKLGHLPNFDITKLSDNAGTTAVRTGEHRGTHVSPGLLGSEKSNIIAVGSLAVRQGMVVAMSSRKSQSEKSDTRSAIQMFQKMDDLREKNGEERIGKIRIFGCLSEADSGESKIVNAMRRNATERWLTIFVKGSNTLPTDFQHDFELKDQTELIAFSVQEEDQSLASKLLQGVSRPSAFKRSVADEWEVVGPDGSFLKDTEENRAKSVIRDSVFMEDEGSLERHAVRLSDLFPFAEDKQSKRRGHSDVNDDRPLSPRNIGQTVENALFPRKCGDTAEPSASSGQSKKRFLNKIFGQREDVASHFLVPLSSWDAHRQLDLFWKKTIDSKKNEMGGKALAEDIQTAMRFIDTLPTSLVDDDVRQIVANICGEAMKQWGSFSRKNKDKMLRPIVEQLKNNEKFLFSYYEEFRDAIFVPDVLRRMDGPWREQVIQALRTIRNAHQNNDHSNSQSRICASWMFFELAAAEWKKTRGDKTQTDSLKELKATLSETPPNSLHYFDLFIYARSAEEKREIAKAAFVFVRQYDELDYSPIGKYGTYGLPSVMNLLQRFSLASLETYHVLEGNKDGDFLRGRRDQSSSVAISADELKKVTGEFHGIVEVLHSSSYLDTGWRHYRTPEEGLRPLIVDAAFKSISLLAEITGKEAVKMLCAGKSDEEAREIDKTLQDVRKSLSFITRVFSTDDRELSAIRQELAQHVQAELLRTQK